MRLPCITEPCRTVILQAARELQGEPLDVVAVIVIAIAAALLTMASLRRQRCAIACTAGVLAIVLHLCSHGRVEQELATRSFPHASCRALGILELNHVPALGPPVTITAKDNQTWHRGHRRWPVCEWPQPRRCTRPSASPGPVVLVTLDQAYVSILPSWSKAVRAANLSCAVGSLDRSNSVCSTARRVGCTCIRSARLPTVDGMGWGRGSPRRVSVRARFELARTLLSGGGGVGTSAATEAGVLMHDADVAFDDLDAFACFLRRQVTLRDLIVQPNGQLRKEAYDDLNLGLTWLSPSERTRQLLNCVLATWDHAAFERQPSEPIVGGSYFERSQPRFAHLLESSLEAAVAPPRVCTLPAALQEHYTHATNLASPAAKLQRLGASAHDGCPSELRPYSCGGGGECSRQADILVRAARRAAPRFLAHTSRLSYRVTGAFPSEMVALVGAIEAMHATHLFESGTASGVSTEMIASHFSGLRHSLAITTIDTGTLYGSDQNNATRKRLARFPNVDCRLADSRLEIPRLLDALPPDARAVVFVDGPKGVAGKTLALSALRHPRVVLVALHDTAPFWDSRLHAGLRDHDEHLLMTSDAAFRHAFGGLDERAGVRAALSRAPRTGPAAGKEGLSRLLRFGNGLWLAGRGKLRSGPLVHIALGTDARGIVGLLAVIRSTLAATAERSRLVFHVLSARAEREAVARQLRQVTVDELGGATLDLIPLTPHASDSSAVLLEQARFQLPQLLPSAVRKVLYVDVDVLVLADPTPLVDASFEGEHRGCAIAAVPRPKPLLESLNLTHRAALALGLSALPPNAWSFNAGVMLLNLDVWRAAGLTRRVQQLARGLTHSGFRGLPGMSTPADSQSTLCLFFQNMSSAIQEIPAHWNVDGLGWKLERLHSNELCAARALHWSGAEKPWLQLKAKASARSLRYRKLWRKVGGARSMAS